MTADPAFGSDIAEQSAAISEEGADDMRRSEGWHRWNAENHPELYNEEQIRFLLEGS